jgi:hypothetical protein
MKKILCLAVLALLLAPSIVMAQLAPVVITPCNSQCVAEFNSCNHAAVGPMGSNACLVALKTCRLGCNPDTASQAANAVSEPAIMEEEQIYWTLYMQGSLLINWFIPDGGCVVYSKPNNTFSKPVSTDISPTVT